MLDQLCTDKEEIAPTLLLHSCCAPCSSYVLEYLSRYFRITVLYYNPNIYPESEYHNRVQEQMRLIRELPTRYPVNFLEGDYIPADFYHCAKGMEEIPEGGKRCFACYRLSNPAAAAAVLEQYNALETAPVEKHSKRGKKIVNLKEHIPQLSYTVLGDTVQLELCLPAAQELNLNPSLLTGFLEEKFGLPAASANILRTKFLTADRQLFV